MRALVTGGAGFIGSNLVDALLAQGDEVTVLDDISTGRRENLVAALDAGAQLLEGSITDATAVTEAFAAAQPEAVYHLGAQIDVRKSVEDPAFDAAVNVGGTALLLEAAREASTARFVLACTGGAIYGDAETIPTPEDAPRRPLAPYGASKAAAEDYLALYARLYGMSTLSLRLANVYGPRQDPLGEAGVIAIYCGAATDGRPGIVFGDGRQTRDFVYVGDVVEAFVAGGRSEAVGHCNVATGRETTVLELAEALGIQTVREPERAGEVRRSCLDPARARELIGWRARTSLQDGLARTLDAAR